MSNKIPQKIPPLRIRKAKINDSQAIRKLEHKVWGEEVVNKYDIPSFVRFGYVFIAEKEDKIVGAIVSYATNKNEVFVCDLVVDPKSRRQKIGERLYRKLLNEVKGRNVVSFINPILNPTVRLHQKLGAKIIKKITNAYDLARGLETDTRWFVRIKN